MFHGNKSSRWKSTPNCPSGAEPISTFGMIEHDSRRFAKCMLYTKTSHHSGAYHDVVWGLKCLREEVASRLLKKRDGVAGTIPVLAQRAASEGPRWTRAVGIIPPTPYKVTAHCGLAR